MVIPCLCLFIALSSLFSELVGAKPLHLLTQTAPPLESPTGAFIAAQTRTFLKPFFMGGNVEENGICSAAFCESAALRVCSLPGGAVAQRLRGFESAEPEKTVKRSSRRTGVNLQFFPVQPTPLGLKGASSPFFVAPARRNRWHFSGSLLVSKENIPALISPRRTARTPVR